MGLRSDKAKPKGAGPSPEEVKSFLAANPEFLVTNVDLFERLVPPSAVSGDQVLDLQQFMISRLQAHVRSLKDVQREMIEASSVNSLVLAQVHKVVLALLDARSFEQLVEYIAAPSGLSKTVALTSAVLCIEESPLWGSVPLRGISVLEKGAIDRMMGGGRESLRLSAHIVGDKAIFGPLAPAVRSEALVRLTIAPDLPPALLALGAANAEQFHPEQGSDLLEFLAHVVERALRRWLGEGARAL
ncbi:MAG: DUF484 family protein [Parvibaculaceae bacterium]|nr:DUF484 family protein [Parvibaculaceae bacterium]